MIMYDYAVAQALEYNTLEDQSALLQRLIL